MKALTIALALSELTAILSAAEKPKPHPLPPVELRTRGGEYGPDKWTWEGVAVVVDPVNHETLYLGGRCGGAESGTLGDWALADDGTTWRAMKSINPRLDPLHDELLATRSAVRDVESRTRNLLFTPTGSNQDAATVRDEIAPPLTQALRRLEKSLTTLRDATLTNWELAARTHAGPLIEKAIDRLRAASAGFSAGKMDAGLVKACFDAQWALDEAADCLRSSPGPRVGALAAYDPQHKCVVLCGGSHGDYVTNDTWIYDCAQKSWRQVWPTVAPTPRASDVEALLPAEKSTGSAVARYDEAKQRVVIAGGVTIRNKMVYQVGFIPVGDNVWEFNAEQESWSTAGDAAKLGAAPASRVYRTVVPAYDPTWFDATARTDGGEAQSFLDGLTANTWTKVPTPERPTAEREWGTARYDSDRDQIYRWSGGHQADPSNVMTTYHPATNRCSIGYVAEVYGKGLSFNGRPDCLNHTYLHWDYDPRSKRVVSTSMAGTGVYNPDRRDWDFTIAQPFNHHVYLTCTVGTPLGLVVWTPGFFGYLDVAAKAWKPLASSQKLPATNTDGSGLAYDAQRNCLWLLSHEDYQKPSGQVWRYTFDGGELAAMDPEGREVLVTAPGLKEIRECICLPRPDLLLLNNFVEGKQLAYDPVKNRWVRLGIAKNLERLGTVSDALTWDSKRSLVWNLNAYNLTYVLKVDPATLTVEPLR